MQTLKDKLSRLTFRQACKWLGPEGETLLKAGGRYAVDLEEQVHLSDEGFTLTLPGAAVTISLDPMRPHSVRLACGVCPTACEHVGAALSLVLEEKLALGLSAPPPERVPIENLSEAELVEQALDDRRERARTEAMVLHAADATDLWSDYSITSALSGKTYRVALRGFERGQSYCSCPDFRKNTLGTCKHILHALEKVAKRFPKSVRQKPCVPKGLAVHLKYGEDLELRMIVPETLPDSAKALVRPIEGRAITDLRDLLSRIRRLEASGHDVLLYPDAEEYINDALMREGLRSTTDKIRQDPATHLLRRTLLETELLPYQMDGIAFAAGAGRAILADDMGLGKTIQGIGVAELPKRTTDIRRIPPTAEQLDLHDGQKRIISSIVRKRYISEMDLLRLQKALLLCRMSANSTFLVDKKAPGYSSKLTELDNLLEQLVAEEGRKIVLFSEWTTMLNLVEPLLDRRAVKYVRLDGSVPQAKRQGLVHRFQKNPDTKLFLTTNAGSTGLNLQAADTVINVDLPWNPAVLEQRISRAHRMGQKRPVHVYLLVTEGTLEESLLGTLSAKHELALAALDPESDVTAVDLSSGVEELKRRLEVLIGAKPEAPLDVSRKRQVEEELARTERTRTIAAAGGRLLGAAFSFLGELLPRGEETEQVRRMAGDLRSRLSECLETGEDGRLTMTVTLPDASALDDLARSLARLFAPGGHTGPVGG